MIWIRAYFFQRMTNDFIHFFQVSREDVLNGYNYTRENTHPAKRVDRRLATTISPAPTHHRQQALPVSVQ